jgi:hypothetical protein
MYFKSRSFYPMTREKERKNQDFLEESKEFNTIIINYSLFCRFWHRDYITLIFQKQTTVFGIPAVVFLILSWLGALLSLAQRIIEWRSNNKEKKKIPILEFDGFYKTMGPQIQTHTPDYKEQATYFVRIIDTNTKSEGQIENANGYLEVKGEEPQRSITRTVTVWSDNNRRSLDFYKQADLMLFVVIGTESIKFPIANKEEGFNPNIKLYPNFINEKLIIEVECKRGVLKEKKFNYQNK